MAEAFCTHRGATSRRLTSSGSRCRPTRPRSGGLNCCLSASVRERLRSTRPAASSTPPSLRDTNFWKLDLTRPGSPPEDAHLAPSTLDEHTPSYSPDGTRIVFASTRSGSEELWIANGDGTSPRQVTRTGGAMCSAPQWSPDGQHHPVQLHARRTGGSVSAGPGQPRRPPPDDGPERRDQPDVVA